MTMETASADLAPRGRRGNTTAWIAFVAFVFGLVAMAGLLYRFGDQIGWGPAASAPTPVRAVTAPATAPAPLPARRPPDLETMSQRETVLAAHIAELEARLANVDTSSRVASGFATRAEGLMVAFAARRALDRGLSLGYVEDQLRLRFAAAEPEAVATVSAHLRRSAPPARRVFARVAPRSLAIRPGSAYADARSRPVRESTA